MPVWIVLGVCAAVFVLVIAVAGARGVFDGGMSDEEADVPPAQRLSDDASAEDVAAVRFTPTLWGYRPAEVDDAMARLQARIVVQDAQIAALGGAVPGAGRTDATGPGSTDSGVAASADDHGTGHGGRTPSATSTHP